MSSAGRAGDGPTGACQNKFLQFLLVKHVKCGFYKKQETWHAGLAWCGSHVSEELTVQIKVWNLLFMPHLISEILKAVSAIFRLASSRPNEREI